MILLLLLALSASATEVSTGKPVIPDVLKAEARAAGFSDAEVYCRDSGCFLTYSDSISLDPAPIIAAHVYIDIPAQAAAARTQAIALAKKLKAGTATAAEKDALLLRLCYLLLSRDQ